MKKHSVDYIRNCVEGITGKLSDKQYSEAYAATFKKECHNMQQRIDAIVKSVGGERHAKANGNSQKLNIV